MKRLILTVLYVFLYLGMQAAASFPFRHIGIRDGLPDNYVKNVFGQDEKEFYQEKATVNYPNDYDFTRITEFKHIHPTNSSKTTILKEYPQEYIKNKNTPYYPIFTEENQKKYNQYLEYSKEFENLLLIGRLAEYKYYDMDKVVAAALDRLEEFN